MDEIQEKIKEVGDFSPKLEEILLFLLRGILTNRETQSRDNDARKEEIKQMGKKFEERQKTDMDLVREAMKKDKEDMNGRYINLIKDTSGPLTRSGFFVRMAGLPFR